MGQVNIDWNGIRPLNGGRDKGFEELCAQLARAEAPPASQFVRKGTPDAGVECYAILRDDSEWGWQAKYFDALGDSQWSQIDESVGKALEKHPRLVRYFVCVPLDLPDGRITGRKSAKERWDEHVEKWTKWASSKGRTVEFVYWGSHELLERLARSEHVGRVRFWFDVRAFDGAWFSARLEEALRTAGPRYTREVHVDLPIASEFEAFGRTDRFFDRVKAHARKIREKLRSVEYSEPSAVHPTLDAAAATMSSKVQMVLAALGAVESQPIGSLPFKGIAEYVCAAETAAEEFARLLDDREREQEAKPEARTGMKASPPSYRSNPFRDRRVRLLGLSSELRRAREALVHAEGIAGSALMLLRGVAGTGKTHLLCDVARERVAAGRPTVLLMGQRFVSNDAPWPQALQHLDMAGLSAEEFVGALESAAQAAGSRALLLIDALNEGAGRVIWPSHLAAFVAYLERSPWLGLVLSIRSSYEEIVVPTEVRTRAAAVTHQGFMEHEYDATKTFFVHYGLELPSTPLLAPEFRNPLFLKTLCHGLNAKGERRLPRGFHGMTAVFDLYLSAVNKRLGAALGFDPRTPLVRQALEAVSKALLDSGEGWLTLGKAGEIVNTLLAGRDFERSLYRGLVVEGVLVEEAVRRQGADHEEVVFVAYERFADHLAAKTLLDRYLDAGDPTSAFAPEGLPAFICDEKTYVPPGLLEALCIQIPERTGKELITLAPKCIGRWDLGDVFRQSLIWRTYAAFSDGTREALNKLCRSEHDLHDTLDVLLTVATLPEHPLNALFLDRRLRKDPMPDRDAWWSVYLHQSWGTHSAVDRLVDWASSLPPNTSIDDETVDLCAISLSWMLTTSNRFLRDRATKALVSLLTGRLAAVVRLVERFTDVDDPYVAERVYAVAYGVAMRCHDPVAAGALAACVYACVFAAGSPPPHILLRDYARGVVERALHLGSAIDVVAERIRPPYKSQWPTIPTEDDIKPLLRSRGAHVSGELEWGRNRIGHSVMDDDFAHYVIGTNSSSTSSDWLSLRLDEPPWKPPARPEDQLRSLVAEFSDEERKAWEQFEAADQAHAEALRSLVTNWFAQREKEGTSGGLDLSDLDALALELEKARPPEVATLEETRKEALAVLEAVLTEEHAQRLTEIPASKEDDRDARRPPRFDLGQIQRYILWRVFDLGWTIERFGHFDRFYIGYHGRAASKAERIGKKYQWIAYHEIMGLVADHFQYREQFREEDSDQAYEGPWQDHLRDIDPSSTMRALRGGTSLDGHAAAWWGSARYDKWGDPGSPRDWVLSCNDLPKVEELLIVTDPADGSLWLNGQGYFNWKQQPPADRESTDVEHRELWYICRGYLIRTDDAQPFLKWAEGVDFWGRWMPDAAEVYRMFLGEHAWAPASRYFQQQYYGDDGWTQPNHGCPVKIRTVAFEYLREASGFDCSVDEGYTLRLPASELVTGLGIRWSGSGADFVDPARRVAAQDPTVHADGPSALLLREDLLREFLAREKLTICWAVLGEKRVLLPGFGAGPYHPSLRMSGAYVLEEGKPIGFVKRMLDDPNAQDRKSGSRVIEIVRNGPKDVVS
jgi:hypothetical protein